MSFLLFGAKFLTSRFSGLATEMSSQWEHQPCETLAGIPDAVGSFEGKMIFVDLLTSQMVTSTANQSTWPIVCKDISENFFNALVASSEIIKKQVNFNLQIYTGYFFNLTQFSVDIMHY